MKHNAQLIFAALVYCLCFLPLLLPSAVYAESGEPALRSCSISSGMLFVRPETKTNLLRFDLFDGHGALIGQQFAAIKGDSEDYIAFKPGERIEQKLLWPKFKSPPVSVACFAVPIDYRGVQVCRDASWLASVDEGVSLWSWSLLLGHGFAIASATFKVAHMISAHSFSAKEMSGRFVALQMDDDLPIFPAISDERGVAEAGFWKLSAGRHRLFFGSKETDSTDSQAFAKLEAICFQL